MPGFALGTPEEKMLSICSFSVANIEMQRGVYNTAYLLCKYKS